MSDPTKKILIAEDNPGLARVLAFKMKAAGYTPITCGDGRAAWEAFQANPDVVAVLSDHEMPYLSGVELFERIRETNQQLPLFLVTGRQLELSQTEIASRLNLAHIFGKPFSPGVLLSELEKQLARSNDTGSAVVMPIPTDRPGAASRATTT